MWEEKGEGVLGCSSTYSSSAHHPFSWCCTAATQSAIEPEVPRAVVAVWELELTE